MSRSAIVPCSPAASRSYWRANVSTATAGMPAARSFSIASCRPFIAAGDATGCGTLAGVARARDRHRGASRPAAVLMLAEALAFLSPAVALASLTVGPQVAGKGLAQVQSPETVVSGLLQVGLGCSWLALLTGAWSAWRGRRPRLGALLAQPVVIAFAVIDILHPLTWVSHLPGSRIAR